MRSSAMKHVAGPVTLDDVAARAGVSRWTVAAAMRGRGRVNPDTAKRLRSLAAEMGYDPALTQAGRSLAEARHGRQLRNDLVAVVLPADYLDMPFYARLLRGALLGLAEGGSAGVLSDLWRVMFTTIDHDARYGSALLRGRVDAAIVHPTDQEAVGRLLAGWREGRFGSRPVVSLIRRVTGLPCAGVDHRPALVAALRQLISLGHRRIGFLRWAGDDENAAEQAALHVVCLAEAGLGAQAQAMALPIPMAWISPKRAPHRPDELGPIDAESETRLVGWLRAEGVTALFAPNDAAALHVCAALRRAGLRVPEDVSVVGCDATDDLADGGPTRFLATIEPDLAAVGRDAARTALAMVAGETGADSVAVSQFLPGRSLGPVRA